MELQTLNQVSKMYGVSARMLRYHEQIGLIESLRKEDYAYRVYDEDALRRLQQIIINGNMQLDLLFPIKAATVSTIGQPPVTEFIKEGLR